MHFKIKNKRNVYVAGWVMLAVVGIFAPDLGANLRSLAVEDEDNSSLRALQAVTPPEGTDFSCDEDEEKVEFDFSTITLAETGKPGTQVFTMANGYEVTFTASEHGTTITEYDQAYDGYVVIGTNGFPDATDVISRSGGSNPEYPENYVSLTISFDRPIDGLLVAVTDLDSTSTNTDASRITLFDQNGDETPTTITSTGDIKVIDNFAYEQFPSRSESGVGWNAAIYAKGNGLVQSIRLDQSMFIFDAGNAGKTNNKRRGVFPGAGLQYCAKIQTEAPDPTPAPVTAPPVTRSPVTPSPVTTPTTPAPVFSGVTGDPLMMGLQGQLFRFDGRSGGWYSAISSPSFQWNMRVTQFEGCPDHSNTFASGAGFTFFDKNKQAMAKVEINVVNEHTVDIGCGSGSKACLGAGSLEILIDGQKIVAGGDYQFGDKRGRVLAFNTFYQCSRKWYDFDIIPDEKISSLRDSRDRRLATLPDIFDVVNGLKGTMIDKEVCEKWISDRKQMGDLFDQPGHYSTIMIVTDSVTFHIEYKQENERCSAHSLDVWMSAVSPSLLNEDWEGILGETKAPLTGEKKDLYDRKEVLKFADDADYEVSSPFAIHCKGCAN